MPVSTRVKSFTQAIATWQDGSRVRQEFGGSPLAPLNSGESSYQVL
ncbi:hypothetical protein RISK_001640 [Rhodopirellula islandica]|uniref:Uncharacterized protein n=1 Tax=Rhodopirellula islandica TaxID=595434 RepID=A0A0J1ELN9_RHOIS|nr:hypothetical protein RISK_001640 [Rhodopirellula islandica]